jgi:signal-transduction protein with cAMP-binding, CBS, and nucleotidyltransferase domain
MPSNVPFNAAAGLDTQVSEVMHRGVISLPATATLVDVATTMRDNDVHAVLVTGGDGSALGWVTSRGMLHNHARDWTAEASARDAITEAAGSVSPASTLADAVTVFMVTGATHILVAAPGEAPVGVLADSDLVAFMAR